MPVFIAIVALIGGLAALVLVLLAASHTEDLIVQTIVDLVKYAIDTVIKAHQR